MSRLISLYPSAWRTRYGEELEDLAATRPLGLRGSIDLVLGAIDAHRHPELVDPSVAPPTGTQPVSRQRYEDLRAARRLGTTSWVGAVAWIFAWVIAANGPVVGTGEDAYRDGGAAMPVYFAALLMLSAGLVGQMIRLPGRARVAQLGAFIAIFAAPLWGLGPWLLMFAFALCFGLLLLAIGAWWSNEWSAATSMAVIAPTLSACVLGVVVLGIHVDRALGEALAVAFVSLLTPVWLVVGASLQSLPDVVEAAPARDDNVPETAPA
jgi:hypothetical protein